jgi:hypothetical protein
MVRRSHADIWSGVRSSIIERQASLTRAPVQPISTARDLSCPRLKKRRRDDAKKPSLPSK